MTDKIPPLPTPTALPSQPAFPSSSGVPSRDVARKQEVVEEEPYTIQCICGYPDDDGNTIYCETCDTWQHIECYYPDNVEDALRPNFAHSCAECEPRSLDRQQAIARQRARTTVPVVETAADKKPKRPPSKSHKKKPKPSELQINGVHAAASVSAKHASVNDNPHPPKKAKNSHRSSQSISSQAPKRSPSHATAKAAHHHPLSPATTPPDLPEDFEIHNYSSGFMSLYSDQAFQIVNTNRFANLQVSSAMEAWLCDPEQMRIETGLAYGDVFQKLPAAIESMRVKPEVVVNKKIVAPSTLVQWQCLRAPSNIAKDVPLMEVNGRVGFQLHYCGEPESRWSELTTPLPFVLFHPLLPLYIDMRREGSEARFVRRSCRPNAVLETYLSSENEYHFWLVSDRPIAAKEQITIPWDFRFPAEEKARALQLFGLGEDLSATETEPVVTDEDYQKYAGWVHLILSEHGGCACNQGSDCAFARFHRNYLARNQVRPIPPKTKKRKPKAQHAISPTSTGHATNSRAASEGHLEDIPENDRRSVSSASRSKPPSRDLTPTARQGSFDTLGILTEPTDRDKRKVAMVEDTFRRMEQQQQQPVRKRKRASDGTVTTQSKSSKPNSATNTPNLPTGFSERGYVNAATGTSKSKSGSPRDLSPTRPSDGLKNPRSRTRSAPAQPRRASTGRLANYCDAAVQTDFPDTEETAAPETVTPRRKVGSCLRKRMLETWHHLRLEEERSKRRAVERPTSSAMSVDGPGDAVVPVSSPTSVKETPTGSNAEASLTSPNDHPMPDAQRVSTTNTSGQAAPTASLTKTKSPDLRVELPPVPAFQTPASAPLSASTPMSAGPMAMQSPFSLTSFGSPFATPLANGVSTPSPVKKKLSLSDYKSRMNKAAAARPSVGTTSLQPVPSSDEPKSAASTESEKVPETAAAETTDATPTSAVPAPAANGSV